jgi:hypothetical protein
MNSIDFELNEAIQDLIESGVLNDKDDACGVARQVIHQGYGSLTPKQRSLYDQIIVPVLKKRAQDLETARVIDSNPD